MERRPEESLSLKVPKAVQGFTVHPLRMRFIFQKSEYPCAVFHRANPRSLLLLGLTQLVNTHPDQFALVFHQTIT